MNKIGSAFTFFITWIIFGGIIGSLLGLIATLFLNTLYYITMIRETHPDIVIFLPVAGAFIGFLYTRFGRRASRGANLVLEEIYSDIENIPISMGILVFIATMITHLFGGSAGREGTGIQMGASIADFVGKYLNLTGLQRKFILMSGISAGFGAFFGAPLAGTIFAMEVINIGKVEYDAMVPCIISAFTGKIVTMWWEVPRPIFMVDDIAGGKFSLEVISKVIVASIIFAFASICFSSSIRYFKKAYAFLFPNLIWRASIGGAILLGMILIVGKNDYIGLGTEYMRQSFFQIRSISDSIYKIIFTSLTLGCGFQGGELTPLLFTGSALGSSLAPYFNLPVSFLAALGAVSLFAGSTNAPITAFLMGIELYGGHNASYLFLSCILTYLFSGNKGIYTSQRLMVQKAQIFRDPTLK